MDLHSDTSQLSYINLIYIMENRESNESGRKDEIRGRHVLYESYEILRNVHSPKIKRLYNKRIYNVILRLTVKSN